MHLSSLHRYPVKSLLGESLQRAHLTETGLDGDRRYALLDTATGLIASAKHPRLWRSLLTAKAEGDLTVHINGRAFTREDAGKALNELTGRDVTLIDTPPATAQLHRAVPEKLLDEGVEEFTTSTLGAILPGTFFDFGPVHVITTATLRSIGEHAGHDIAPARYRPNLVIDTDTPGYPEDTWDEITVGPVKLKAIVPSPRCVVPTLAHGDLPPDPDAMCVLAKHHRVETEYGVFATAGAYFSVLEPGDVRLGDAVKIGG
ncbi:molybdenum cofactor biosynthesis protein [Actinorhabdospora filicis]|uniref:Molybdenum cofactor biosynthesis protein n=1 Tax=Actinorhabdospora filicis TaxID=1785913 RepID=A0A9W6SQK0_9ACTN|nr:MOSC N-terminal beta barrel domain-containing protein [Actinorhabdospora filicis]GLZ81119.1 molybdenum cofactor biosynthesis protein [Actinorhabdospora filicis]